MTHFYYVLWICIFMYDRIIALSYYPNRLFNINKLAKYVHAVKMYHRHWATSGQCFWVLLPQKTLVRGR